jgi:hypothetical protein
MGLFANSRYLKQEDVGEEGWVLTIAGINQENVARKDEKPEIKFVLHFAEPDVKPLALNTINAKMIAKITGIDDEQAILAGAWNGARIVLYQDPNVIMGGETVGGIRVKAVPGTRPPQPQQGYRQPAPSPYQQPPPGYAQPPQHPYPPQGGYQQPSPDPTRTQPAPGSAPPRPAGPPPSYGPRATAPTGYPPQPAGSYTQPPANAAYPLGHQPAMDFDPGDQPPADYVPPHPGGPL